MHIQTNTVEYIHIQNDTDRYDKEAHPVGSRAVLSCAEHLQNALVLASSSNRAQETCDMQGASVRGCRKAI